jgi:hypothetical protein
MVGQHFPQCSPGVAALPAGCNFQVIKTTAAILILVVQL